MSKRWLSGVLIFALGFGCTSLVATAAAQEVPAEETGTLEEGLDYVNTENEIRLINRGKNIYVFMVQRRSGLLPADTPVLYTDDAVTIARYGLNKLVAYRLEPIAILERSWRPCFGADCSWIGPLPPPPPPIVPPDLAALFLTPSGL